MANTDKWYGADSYNDELSLDELEEVSGGRVKASGYATLLAAMRILKKNGYDVEYAKKMIAKGWDENCPYREKCTDGTDEDLQKTMDFIEKNW